MFMINTYIKIEPEDEDDVEANVDDTECDEDVSLKGHEEIDAMVDEHRDHCMPHAYHTQNDQWQQHVFILQTSIRRGLGYVINS